MRMELRHSKDWAILNDNKKEEEGGTQGGLASPGSGEARRNLYLQSQPCLSEREDKSGGEEKMVKGVIQGLANPESGT